MVRMDADLYRCYPSWVVADILAKHYGVPNVSPFDDHRRKANEDNRR